MNGDDVTVGLEVRITTDRVILGRTFRGQVGTVWAVFDRDVVEDWVYVRVASDGIAVIGFRPSEVEPA